MLPLSSFSEQNMALVSVACPNPLGTPNLTPYAPFSQGTWRKSLETLAENPKVAIWQLPERLLHEYRTLYEARTLRTLGLGIVSLARLAAEMPKT